MRKFERYYPATDKTRCFDLAKPFDMVRFVAREQFAFPGGYELALIVDDGGLVCSSCAKENYRLILVDTKEECNTGWRAAGMTNDSELEDDYCSHCGKSMGYQTEEEEVEA